MAETLTVSPARPGQPTKCSQVSLGTEEVHVWHLNLDLWADREVAMREILCPLEQLRADRFHFETDRRRFTIGRAVLRELLGGYLGQAPAGIKFHYGTQGKPALDGASARNDFHFNLSHCGGSALLAFARHEPASQTPLRRPSGIGIDVEAVRSLPDFDDLVARFFSPRETRLFQRLAAAEKPVAFFNLWTRKEALLKATGDGIGELLNQVEVTFVPGEPPRVLSAPAAFGTAGAWKLLEIPALSREARYAAALACPFEPSRVRCCDWRG